MKNDIKKAALYASLIVLGIIIATSYFKCQKDSQTTPNIQDSLKLAQQRAENLKLRHENDSLKNLKRIDSIAIVALNHNIEILEDNHTVIINQIKELPFDDGCILAQEGFIDTTKIMKVEFDKKIRACITPNQLTEVNIAFSDRKYLIQLNDSLDKNLNLMLNTDVLNNEIIKNLELMLNNSSDINKGLESRNNILQQDLDKMTKQYKRQRFWKYVTKGAAAILITMLALK